MSFQWPESDKIVVSENSLDIDIAFETKMDDIILVPAGTTGIFLPKYDWFNYLCRE